MKSKIFSILLSAAMLTGVAACDSYEPNIQGEGTGRLNTASLEVEVSNAEKIVNDQTGAKKAPGRATIDLTNYIVKVTDSKGNPVKQWTYAEMPELPSFPAGTYSIEVISRETPTGAEWDAPFFRGTQSFTIVADEVTDVDPVKCMLSNIRVTVRFTDELVKASAGDIKAVVRSEGLQSLAFSPDETRSGYFAAVDGLVTLSVQFTGTVSGTEEKFTRALTEVEAGQHRIITFGLRTNPAIPPSATGNVSSEGINVSTDVVEEDLTADVPYEEDVLPDTDRPGQEGDDPSHGDDPNPPTPGGDEITFTSPLDLDTEYDVVTFNEQKLEASLDVKAPAGFRSIVVKIDSENLGPELPGLGLREEFDLATVTGDEATAIAGLGFPVGDEVTSATTLHFDITSFVTLLEGFQGRNYFYITVTDKNGVTKATQFKFYTK